MNNYSLWDVIKNILRFIWGRTHNFNQFANFYYTLNKRQIFLLLSLLFLFFFLFFFFFFLFFFFYSSFSYLFVKVTENSEMEFLYKMANSIK